MSRVFCMSTHVALFVVDFCLCLRAGSGARPEFTLRIAPVGGCGGDLCGEPVLDGQGFQLGLITSFNQFQRFRYGATEGGSVGCGAEQTTACLGEVQRAVLSAFGRLPGGFLDAALGVLGVCASVETSAVQLAEAAVVTAL